MADRKASDLHLRAGIPPTLRVDGELMGIETDNLTPEQLDEFVKQILSEEQLKRYKIMDF